MHDFLNSKLFPKVSCKTACMDGYEAENLISNNYLVKSRGFMAFTSIKPPIDVHFILICSVNIGYIRIKAANGSQKISGVEILGKSPKSELVSIAQATFDKSDVVFCNSRTYNKQNPPPNCSDITIAFFKANTFRVFLNASEVIVRITRVDRTSVPCLGRVEIWGNISKSCSQETFMNVTFMANGMPIRSSTDELAVKNAQPTNNFTIPDEYKDEITYEIMSLPMTLPSGHTVDQSTIEKCINNDNSYGRLGTDPFTGLTFTNKRKPILNVALKSRIDMFLVENSHRKEVANVQRTVGRKPEMYTAKQSYVNTIYNKVSTNNTLQNVESVHKAKRFKVNSFSLSSICNSELAVIEDNSFESGGPSRSMDDKLTDTINKIMNSNNFTRFTSDGSATNVQDQTFSCGDCNSRDNLYTLPCTHLYCRTCLIKLCKSKLCGTCKQTFKTSDPKKFNWQ